MNISFKLLIVLIGLIFVFQRWWGNRKSKNHISNLRDYLLNNATGKYEISEQLNILVLKSKIDDVSSFTTLIENQLPEKIGKFSILLNQSLNSTSFLLLTLCDYKDLENNKEVDMTDDFCFKVDLNTSTSEVSIYSTPYTTNVDKSLQYEFAKSLINLSKT